MIHIEFLTVQTDIAVVLSLNIFLMHFVIYAILGKNLKIDCFHLYENLVRRNKPQSQSTIIDNILSDNFYLDSFTRYIVSPYIIAVIALGGMQKSKFYSIILLSWCHAIDEKLKCALSLYLSLSFSLSLSGLC